MRRLFLWPELSVSLLGKECVRYSLWQRILITQSQFQLH